MEESPLESASTFSTSPAKRKINKRFIYLIIAVIAVVLIFFLFKTLGGNKTQSIDSTNTNVPTETPTETPFLSPTKDLTPTTTDTPTPTKSPTPAPTSNPVDEATGLDRSELSITVENGSGEAGVAGKGSDYLKSLGYDVTSTGNADNFDYINVTIQVKSSESDFLSLLKKDLGVNYTIESATSDLSDSFSTDALVIIGK